MKKILRYPILIMFAVFIAAFSLADWISPPREFSELENRYLKQRPTPSVRNIFNGEYSSAYEEYINDQFILRDEWITLKSYSESALLKTENNGIVYGKDGRLFDKYTDYPADQLEKNLGFLQEFMQGRGNVTMMIVPSSYEIYPEQLPAGLTLVDQQEKIAEIYAGLPDNVTTIDLYPTLMAAKEGDIYYRTDHHWTTDGAYLGYQAFCEAKNQTPVSLESLTAHDVSGFLGTFFSKCKKAGTPSEVLRWYELPIAEVTVDGQQKDSYLDLSALETRDKYGAFLWGNGGITVLTSESGAQKPTEDRSRILVIKDSFANCFSPFLTANYDEVWIVDLRSMPKGLTELVEQNSFTDILFLYNFTNLASDTNLFRLRY
ncbi:MAG: DHHW family protein [Candidatus Merdivicinus sp.]|jgi:hypothetical protein